MLNKKLCWWVVCLVIVSASSAIAMMPRPEQHDYVVCSSSGNYCADVSASGFRKVDVFKKDKGQRIFCYSMDVGWHDRTFLSDDGEKFITLTELIPKQLIHGMPAVRVWVHGVLSQTLYIDQIVDFTKREPGEWIDGGAEVYVWGPPSASFEGSKRFVIQLYGDSKANFFNGPKYVIELD
jgi:hypothetical protein